MRAGVLDRKVTIQRRTVTQDAAGQEVVTWSAIAHRRAAAIATLTADERFAANQFIAREQVAFEIRWSSSVADVNPLDRVLYPPPADEDEQAPTATTIYDILAVEEIGRRRGLKVTAARRTEA